MKPFLSRACLILLALATLSPCPSAQESRIQSFPQRIESFDADWRFLKADVPHGESPALDDTSWRRLDVPHDWAIEGPFEASNPSGGAGAFAPADIGWYRKHFSLPQSTNGKRVFLEFDGVMANSDVWINGVLLGQRPYGYVSFQYELTPNLKYSDGTENVLAVRADNSTQPSSRFYEGAGIYRHVHLIVVNPVHLQQWSTFVSTPHVTPESTEVRLQSNVVNQSSEPARVHLEIKLTTIENHSPTTMRTSEQTIAAGQTASFTTSAKVKSPSLWDISHPNLYQAETKVIVGGKATDSETVPFGIREFHFDPATGFWLNGRNLKIKGVTLHSDIGSLGMAAPLGAWEHRLTAMRKMGVNAIRTAHNPVAPEFLDLCDRLGFLVMDEMFDQWTVAKNKYDYHLYFPEWHLTDLRDTVRRDRNHPSIILYSAGNEIHDTPNAELARSLLGPMVDAFHHEDPTRLVTQALFRPNVSHDYDDGLADMLDIVGQNYRENEILAAHAAKPTRKIIGTENTHERNAWLPFRDHPEYSGQFIWAGTDYLGESRHWPIIGDASGLYDRTDHPKPDGLERESWWSEQPVVHIARRVAPTQRAPTDPGYEADQYRPRQVVFPDWTPANTSPHTEQVEVYSNCDEVELQLNGKSLGSKPRNANDSPRIWAVPFEAGTVTALGHNANGTQAREELRTAGKPITIRIEVERQKLTSQWDDVAYIRAYIVDDKNTIVTQADNTLSFKIKGPGKLLSTDSGDNADHSGFQKPDRQVFQGNAIAIVRATAGAGNIMVEVSSEGLASASTKLPITPQP